jgi:hypothetical protein
MKRAVRRSTLAALILLTLLACHLDVGVKGTYTFNKMVLFAGIIEDYHASIGKYPADLEQVRSRIVDYLKQNPGMEGKFMISPWTKTQFDLFESGFGRPISYLQDTSTDSYFLVTPTTGWKAIPRLERLRQIRDGRTALSGFFVVSNGDFIAGPCEKVKGIGKDKLERLMRPIQYKGHGLFW